MLKPETAITMRRMMEGVVIKPYGTGHKYARPVGYTSAGKTGTAQIYDYRTHQYTHMYNASFMGFAPVTNPAIVVVVTVNGTEGTVVTAARLRLPCFAKWPPPHCASWTCPKICPRCFRPRHGDQADENDVAIADLVLPSLPRWSKRKMPLPPTTDRRLPQNSALDQRTFLAQGDGTNPARDLAGPRVPNFQGKTMRDVIEQSAALGIPVEFTGSGIARGAGSRAGRHPAVGTTRYAFNSAADVAAMTLEQILQGVRLRSGLSEDLREMQVTGLEYDSRRVEPGFLFFAFPGARADGREFAQSAMDKGAVAVASELAGAARIFAAAGSKWSMDGGRWRWPRAIFMAEPDARLSLTGVTGTNGKTTTTFLIDADAAAAGKTTAWWARSSIGWRAKCERR